MSPHALRGDKCPWPRRRLSSALLPRLTDRSGDLRGHGSHAPGEHQTAGGTREFLGVVRLPMAMNAERHEVLAAVGQKRELLVFHRQGTSDGLGEILRLQVRADRNANLLDGPKVRQGLDDDAQLLP